MRRNEVQQQTGQLLLDVLCFRVYLCTTIQNLPSEVGQAAKEVTNPNVSKAEPMPICLTTVHVATFQGLIPRSLL